MDPRELDDALGCVGTYASPLENNRSRTPRASGAFPLRVTICWTEFAGYTAACWRELASRADVDLRILAWPSNLSRSGTQFDRALVGGLPVRFLEGAEQ